MSLYTQFKTSGDLEKKGILLQYGQTAAGKDICIRIARAGGANKQFDKRMEILTKPIRRQLQNETADIEQIDVILRRVYAETVILGWENIEDANGKPIEFTVDNVIKLLTDLPDLFEDIKEQAKKGALFREENLRADAGN